MECTRKWFTLREWWWWWTHKSVDAICECDIVTENQRRWSSESQVRSKKRSGEWWFCQWSCLTLLWYNHTNCVLTQAIRARARGKVATELFIKQIQRRRKWCQLELPLLRSPSWKATRAFINWYIRWVRRRPLDRRPVSALRCAEPRRLHCGFN